MDPSLSVVIITAGSILKGPVEEFLKRIGGPAGDEIGGWLCDKVRDYRGTNVKQAVVSAQSMLAEAGGEIRDKNAVKSMLSGALVPRAGEQSDERCLHPRA